MSQECNSKRIKLKNVSNYIGLKEPRSIEKWCNNNEVTIYLVKNRKFVYLQQVIDAVEKEFVEGVRREMPDEYLSICKEYVSTRTLEKYSFSSSTYSDTNILDQSAGNYPDDVKNFINNI